MAWNDFDLWVSVRVSVVSADVGVHFLSGTGVLIYGDVLNGAPLTEKHYRCRHYRRHDDRRSDLP